MRGINNGVFRGCRGLSNQPRDEDWLANWRPLLWEQPSKPNSPSFSTPPPSRVLFAARSSFTPLGVCGGDTDPRCAVTSPPASSRLAT